MQLTSDTASSLNSEAVGLSQPELVGFDLVSLNFGAVGNTLVIYLELLLKVVKVGYE